MTIPAQDQCIRALELLKAAEFEVLELIRDTANGVDSNKLHDAKISIWDAIETIAAMR